MKLQLSEEMSSGAARMRIDVYGPQPVEHVLEDTVFLNYRLANIAIEPKVTRPRPDVVWRQDVSDKTISMVDGALTLTGEWFQGELQKTLVSAMAMRMEETDLHPFHSSAVRYNGKTILFLGGESNHGKSMSQIEGCREPFGQPQGVGSTADRGSDPIGVILR